jgi:glycosyltransferase involved in cell wall biosynthesis
VFHLAAGLESCGHQVTILAHAVDAPHDHPRVVELPAPRQTLVDRVLRRLVPDRWFARSMAKRHAAAISHARARYGIEIVVMEETQGWIGETRKRVAIPMVATLHGPWWLHRATGSAADDRASARREAREISGLRGADAITAPSRDVLVRTEAIWSLPDCPKAVIANSVPLPDTAVDMTPHLLDRVLFVGRFDHIKGGDLVLDAFALISAANPRCELSFVGPDVGLPRADGTLETLSDRLGTYPADVRSRVKVLGRGSREDIAAHRLTHGITLVASRYETFGGTVVEAMAVGSAVVCTEVGGCRENVSHGRTGLLVPPDDAAALAAACLHLMSNPELCRTLGAAARKHVAKTLAPEIIGRQMAAFLTPLCRR